MSNISSSSTSVVLVKHLHYKIQRIMQFFQRLQIFGNFSSVHLSHVELKNMGQQGVLGSYPVHFHMCGDVDQKGGYQEPTYVDGLSIHHSFSRCLTVHATNGLLVSKMCVRCVCRIRK